uniref:Ovule protein n=1 Tax=Panagrellus redivivus TaxID=6233 RepID=A0A7E4W5A8_PANRE
MKMESMDNEVRIRFISSRSTYNPPFDGCVLNKEKMKTKGHPQADCDPPAQSLHANVDQFKTNGLGTRSLSRKENKKKLQTREDNRGSNIRKKPKSK